MPGILGFQSGGTGLSTGLSGILSQFTAGGGILSTAIGPLQTRLATVQAAGTLQAKITALAGTLGSRLKAGGLLGSLGGTGGTSSMAAPARDTRYLAGAQRTYASPSPPKGLEFS